MILENNHVEQRLDYERFTNVTDRIHKSFEGVSPNYWWLSVTHQILWLQKDVVQRPEEYSQPIVDFVNTYAHDILAVLKEESRRPVTPRTESNKNLKRQAHEAKRAMHALSYVLRDATECEDRVPDNYIPIGDLVGVDGIDIIEKVHPITGGNVQYVTVSVPNGLRCEFMLPLTDEVIHKGGAPRLVLKKFGGAPLITQNAEVPLNDIDLIAVGEEHDREEEVRLMGADADGLEMVPIIDYSQLFRTRDIDLNAVFLARDGLHYAKEAYEAARTGHIALWANDRGIYGMEFFYYEDERVANARGEGRLIKPAAELKVLSFDFTLLNQQVDFGAYWLVLMRKFANKPNRGELMNRVLYLAKQMGQVREEEHDIYAVLDRVHTQRPYFDFSSPSLDEVGLAYWLANKLRLFTNRRFREINHVPMDTIFERRPGDTKPYKVSLDGYVESEVEAHRLDVGWKPFLSRCHARTSKYKSSLLEEAVED